ncbi:MAG: HPr family phosphocarrier protein [Planctomycetes bacterium]|nr:HPr family phosphocarrier protein [Planctomycetota bacterium]
MEIERSLEISNKYGLHARASTRIAQVAQKFRSKVLLLRGTKNGVQEVDAKSVLGILSLGAEKGEVLRVKIWGDDADSAMEALTDLFLRKFDEE